MSVQHSHDSDCDQKYVKSIMKSESEIAESLNEMLKELGDNLEHVFPIDKRVILTNKLVCSYACKEKAMANLVNALADKTVANREICKKHKHEHEDNDTIFTVLLIAALFIGFNSFCWYC